MKRAIITTTLCPPLNLVEWAKSLNNNDIIIVAGDVKTAHDQVKELLNNITDTTGVKTRYVVETDSRTSRIVPMNSIQRRNIAILEAIREDVDFITTVDTDNYPLSSTHMDEVISVMLTPWCKHLIQSSSGWANIGQILVPSVIYRGFPLEIRSNWDQITSPSLCNIGVHSSLWFDDPDIYALERLLHNPNTTCPPGTFVLASDTWCPFNSQATTFCRELLPLLNVWPGVDRMDDIWSSYVARHIINHLNYYVAYGIPNVQQMRHTHNIVDDLEKEIIGYRYTHNVTDVIKSIELPTDTSVIDLLEIMYNELNTSLTLKSIIPTITRTFWKAWIADLRNSDVKE